MITVANLIKNTLKVAPSSWCQKDGLESFALASCTVSSPKTVLGGCVFPGKETDRLGLAGTWLP